MTVLEGVYIAQLEKLILKYQAGTGLATLSTHSV